MNQPVDSKCWYVLLSSIFQSRVTQGGVTKASPSTSAGTCAPLFAIMRSLTHQWVYTSESLSKENKDILWINLGLSTFFQDLDILCINCLSVRAAAVSFLKRFLGLGLNFHLAPCPRASQTQLQFALLLSDFKWGSQTRIRGGHL